MTIAANKGQEGIKMRKFYWQCAAGVLVSVALAGCNREASGQVAAIVNGEEITLQEINAEIGDAKLPPNVDRKAVQQAALQRIIDRRIVAQAAREDGIDKDPTYLARQRQAAELLLIQMYGQKAGRALRMPEGPAIDKYVADHPGIFGERTIYSIDRIQFPMVQNVKQLEQLRDDHTMDAVAAKLTALGIKFTRGPGQLDSARVPMPVLAQIKALPPGEPFVVPEGGMITAASITGSKPAPLTGAEARPIAVEMMRNDELQKLLADRVKTARSAAKIEYQTGFAPPAAKGGGSAPAGAPSAKP